MEQLATEKPGLFEERAEADWGIVCGLVESGLAPPPLISGDDLLAIGFTPGPTLGRILHELYDRQLEGDLRTREDAMRAARTVLKSHSSG